MTEHLERSIFVSSVVLKSLSWSREACFPVYFYFQTRYLTICVYSDVCSGCRSCRATRQSLATTVVASGKKIDIKKQGLNSVQDKVVQKNLMGISETMSKKDWTDSSGRKGKVCMLRFFLFIFASLFGALKETFRNVCVCVCVLQKERGKKRVGGKAVVCPFVCMVLPC